MAEKLSAEDLVRAFALRNAVEHEGQAMLSSVLGSVFSARPGIRKQAGEVARLAKNIVDEVNSLTLDQQREQLARTSLPVEEKKEERTGLPDLPNAVQGKVVMRLAPYPSGQLHLGRARMAVLNDEYVKMYRGRLILVIDDTAGSAEKIPIKEAYDGIPADLKWLGVEIHETVYKSDRLEIFYSYAREFIQNGWAYVCRCPAEKLRRRRAAGEECECRTRPAAASLADWERMLGGQFSEGEAVVRLKTDMAHPDAAFRDRVLLRISERPHPRVGTKYRVWPMLEFSWAIDDHLLGVTHVLRGKDLMMEDRMEQFMWDLLGWPHPTIAHHGMLRIADAKISSSECRRKIESGEYEGWDDPRTWTLAAMRVRGIRAEAIRAFILNFGLTMTDIQVPVESLYAENRKIIDSEADRYHFVRDPVRISISGSPDRDAAELGLHPDHPERGSREVPVDPEQIWVDREDFQRLEGERVRLKDLYNVVLATDSTYAGSELAASIQKIQWVSSSGVKTRVVMPDGSAVEGLADPGVAGIEAGAVIQFVRFGFCRLDHWEGEIAVFRFTHG